MITLGDNLYFKVRPSYRPLKFSDGRDSRRLISRSWQASAVVLRAKRAKPPQGAARRAAGNEVSEGEVARVYYMFYLVFAKSRFSINKKSMLQVH